MILDKTSFLNYLVCERFGWSLFRNELAAELNDERRHRARQGEEVERLCQALFDDGWEISGDREKTARQTRDLSQQPGRVLYQATALSRNGLLAKADITVVNADGSLDLHEVKTVGDLELDKRTPSPQKDKHLNDAAFQKVAFQSGGYRVRRVFLMHINKDYRFKGKQLDRQQYFKKTDVSREVAERESLIKEQIAAARRCYASDQAPECLCRFKSQNRRCETFLRFNRQIPTKNSIFNVSRISPPKLEKLMERNIWKIADIDTETAGELNFSSRQLNQIEVLHNQQPIVGRRQIAAQLAGVKTPVYFLDYETINSPLPIFQHSRPFQQVAFQYSLHMLNTKNELHHSEYLMQAATDQELKRLVDKLRADMGQHGSIIVWHQSAEKSFHKSLVEIMPGEEAFFKSLDGRIFDLEKIFSQQLYVHPAMEGRTSLKNAVHILKRDYYDDLVIQEGGLAAVAWEQALQATPEERERRFEHLLQYCRRDTLAMVEIYQHLRQLTDGAPQPQV